MNASFSAAAGAVPGYLLLVLTVSWARNQCLPVSAHELKWQCEMTSWAIATAYFGATFVATYLAGRRKVVIGSIVFVVLFFAHAVTPHLALISFGMRWYLSQHALLFAVIPAAAAQYWQCSRAEKAELMRPDRRLVCGA